MNTMTSSGQTAYTFATEGAAMTALRTRSQYGIVYRTIDGLWSWALEGTWIGLACEYFVQHKCPKVDVINLQGKVIHVIDHVRYVRPWDKIPSE